MKMFDSMKRIDHDENPFPFGLMGEWGSLTVRKKTD